MGVKSFPNPVAQQRLPRFDLVVMEALAAWHGAIKRARQCELAVAAAENNVARRSRVEAHDRARAEMAKARFAFESVLRTDAHAEAER